MSVSVYCPHNKHVDLPCLHRVERAAATAWLAAGWRDFRRAWPASLSFGVAFGILGLTLLYYAAGQPDLAMALAGGILLLAPLLAAAFYQISRRLEWLDNGRIGAPPAIGRLFGSQGALFGLLLVTAFAIWVQFAMVAAPSTAGEFSLAALFSPASLAYAGIGTLVAAVVYVVGVITLPMLMDRQTDLATAMTTSWLVVKENPAAMATWAAIIAAMLVVGMLSLFIGFAVALPVVGHANWHAYRELVERD